MENQITLSAHKIIDKFMKYAWNFHSVKIGNNYAPECLTATHCPDHLADKFTDYSEREKSGTQGFLKLWHELDGENQELVANWIENNYNG
tara:strand:+ start:375 stop:644 length:270 start_codon:yes stop_codon:yes gene_type:complete